VVAQSKEWACGRFLAGIAGSNPAGGMDVSSLANVVCCEGRDLCQKGGSLVSGSHTACVCVNIQGDRNVSVHLMITVQKHSKSFKQFQSRTMIT
jgi:hypothetical protein